MPRARRAPFLRAPPPLRPACSETEWWPSARTATPLPPTTARMQAPGASSLVRRPFRRRGRRRGRVGGLGARLFRLVLGVEPRDDRPFLVALVLHLQTVIGG